TRSTKAKQKTPRRQKRPDAGDPVPFPIVGIGASAGGLEAFTKLLEKFPVDTGMALVLIQHLDPKHESILTSLISRATRLPVHEVSEGMDVERNHIYVIPPNATIRISGSRLHLTGRLAAGDKHMPVDFFLQSLAETQKGRA